MPPSEAVSGTRRAFLDRTCSAPAERSAWMRDIVLRHVPRSRRVQLLDLGCGTGSLMFGLADALSDASLVGIDVSPLNIAAAEERRVAHPAAARLRFEVADYLEYKPRAFDVIVSDGVLHLIRADTAALFGKLSSDLEAGGILICNMPYACVHNRVSSVVRTLLRPLRSRALDALILAAARVPHGREMDDDRLRERVPYMYFPPERVETPALVQDIESMGLCRVAQYQMPSRSLAQLRHRATVFSKSLP